MSAEFVFEARIWLYEGAGSWHFVTLPKDISNEIHALFQGTAKAFGTVAVTARIGATRWKTSIFRDRKREAYLLPVKAQVRAKEQLRPGDPVEVLLLVG